MNMVYTKVHEAWVNEPDTSTPVDASALDQIEAGIASADAQATTATSAAATAQAKADSAAPATHTHTQAQVTGLVALLADLETRLAAVEAAQPAG